MRRSRRSSGRSTSRCEVQRMSCVLWNGGAVGCGPQRRRPSRPGAQVPYACDPRAVRGTAATPKGPMDDRWPGRAAVRFGNADQERAELGPGIAGAALRAAGGVVGRRSCRRDDVMVELTDGTRKLLSELTGAESAAGFRFRPDLTRPYESESGRLVSLSCHHHDGWAHTLGHTPQNSSRTIAAPG